MKKKIFTIAAFEMALFFWVLESAIHYFVFEEPHFEMIPSELNELWMRIVIAFLIVLLGVFADAFISRIERRQMEVARVYNSLIQAGSNTLANLVEQMRLFKTEADKCEHFDRNVIKYYDNAIGQASDLIQRFSNIDRALTDAGQSDEARNDSDRER